MYTFSIKDNGPGMDVLITRSLLALGGIISLLYNHNQYYFINITASIVLFITAVWINWFFIKFRLNASLLLCVAAIILFIATLSIPFAAILLVFSLLVKKLRKNPIINVNTEGVNIKKMIGNTAHSWSEFNNIILKDNLLTLDFKSNKLLQLNIDESNLSVDENNFNTFCSGFIGI